MANNNVIKCRFTYTREELLRLRPTGVTPPNFSEDIRSLGLVVSGRSSEVRTEVTAVRQDTMVYSGETVRKTKVLTFNKDVELQKAENAWRPSIKKVTEDQDPEEAVTQELFRQMRSILNKLTPEKFEQLMKRIRELSINTEAQLEGIGKMVLEKAIFEMKFASTYAKMCCELKELTVPGSPLNFPSLMLDLCQEEFWKVSDDGVALEKEWQDQQAAEGKDRQNMEELEAKRTANRKRAVGYMKFLGEMYKLGLVKDYVILEFVTEFLGTKTEESMESLCCLITTAGAILDSEELKPVLDRTFRGIESIIQEKKLASRVCFLLQDLVDLRQNNWVPRREEQGPKTIQEIHKEVEEERQLAGEEVHSIQPISKMAESGNIPPEEIKFAPVKPWVFSKTHLKKIVPRDEQEPKPISPAHKKTKLDDQSKTSKKIAELEGKISTLYQIQERLIDSMGAPAHAARNVTTMGERDSIALPNETARTRTEDARVQQRARPKVNVSSTPKPAEAWVEVRSTKHRCRGLSSDSVLFKLQLNNRFSILDEEESSPPDVPSRKPTSTVKRPCTQTIPQVHSGETMRKIKVPTFNKEVELQRPSIKKVTEDQDPEEAVTQELFRQMRRRLNKLTPEKFEHVMKRIRKLSINTEAQLEGFGKIVLEKAICEMEFASTYAKMCCELKELTVPGSPLNFPSLMLDLCQEEFWKVSDDGVVLEKEWQDQQAAEGKDRQNMEELEAKRTANRKRAVGYMKFLGEMYRLGLVKDYVILEFVTEFLSTKTEESMESLCCLITTAGAILDSVELKPVMDRNFRGIESIIQEKKFTSRVCFLLQDLVDLRQNNWVAKKEQGLKTIPEIHKEVEEERQLEVEESNSKQLVSVMEERKNSSPEEMKFAPMKPWAFNKTHLASEVCGSESSEQDEPCEEQLRKAVQVEPEPAVEAAPAEEAQSEHDVDPDPESAELLDSEPRADSESEPLVKIEPELVLESESDLAAESELEEGIDSEQAKEIESEPVLLAPEVCGSESSEQDEPCEEQLRPAVQVEPEPAVEAAPAEEAQSEHDVDPDPESAELLDSELRAEAESEPLVKIESELVLESESDLAAASELKEGIDSEQAKEIESEPVLLMPNGEAQRVIHDVTFCVDSEHQMAPDRAELNQAIDLTREVLQEHFTHHCTAALQEGQEEEEALECLCHILSTIGRKMDDTAKSLVDKCMRLLEDIVKEGKTSDRIRFMIKDIMDLRQNNWAPGNSNQGPKATSQIHNDAELENQQETDKVEQQLAHKMDDDDTHHDCTLELQRTVEEHDSINREVKQHRGEHQGHNRQASRSNEGQPAHEKHRTRNYGENKGYGQDLRWNYREHQGHPQDQRWYHGQHQGHPQGQRWYHGQHQGHPQDQRWYHGQHQGHPQDQRWYHGEHQGHPQGQRWYHGQHQGHPQDQRWYHGQHQGHPQDQRWYHGQHQGHPQDQRWYHGEHQGHPQDQRWYHGEHQGHPQGQRWYHGEHKGHPQDQRWYHGEHQGHPLDQRWYHGEHQGHPQDQRWYHGEHKGHPQDQRWYHGAHQGHPQDQRWYHGAHQGHAQGQKCLHGEQQGRAPNQRQYHGEDQGRAQGQRWRHGQHQGRAQEQRWHHNGYSRA